MILFVKSTILLHAGLDIPTLMHKYHPVTSLTVLPDLFSCTKTTIFIFFFLCFPYSLPYVTIVERD